MTNPDDMADDPPLSKDELAQLASLRAALALGVAGGPPRPFDFAAFLASRTHVGGA